MTHPLAAKFADTPWRQVSEDDLAAAAAVPTMLNRNERQL